MAKASRDGGIKTYSLLPYSYLGQSECRQASRLIGA